MQSGGGVAGRACSPRPLRVSQHEGRPAATVPRLRLDVLHQQALRALRHARRRRAPEESRDVGALGQPRLAARPARHRSQPRGRRGGGAAKALRARTQHTQHATRQRIAQQWDVSGAMTCCCRRHQARRGQQCSAHPPPPPPPAQAPFPAPYALPRPALLLVLPQLLVLPPSQAEPAAAVPVPATATAAAAAVAAPPSWSSSPHLRQRGQRLHGVAWPDRRGAHKASRQQRLASRHHHDAAAVGVAQQRERGPGKLLCGGSSRVFD